MNKMLFVGAAVLTAAAVFSVSAHSSRGSLDGNEGFTVGTDVKFFEMDDGEGGTPQWTVEAGYLGWYLDNRLKLNVAGSFTRDLGDDAKVSAGDDDMNDIAPQEMYVGFLAEYVHPLTDAGKLHVIFQHEFEDIVLAPAFTWSRGDDPVIEPRDNLFTGVTMPAIRYTHTLGEIGDVFGQVGLPMEWEAGQEKTSYGLEIALGYESNFGLEAELTLNFALNETSRNLKWVDPTNANARREEHTGYNGFDLMVGYEIGNFFLSVEAEVPIDVKYRGILLTPQAEFHFRLLDAGYLFIYANVEFDHLLRTHSARAGVGDSRRVYPEHHANAGKEVNFLGSYHWSPQFGVKYVFDF